MPSSRMMAVVALLATLNGCASTKESKPQWVQASDVDISAYSTFEWAEGFREPPESIIDNQIRDALHTELIRKGYVETSDAPDFLVSYEAVEEDAVERRNPVSIGIGMGTWGGNVGGSVGTSVDVGEGDRVRHQQRITIRALDPESKREVWIGVTAPLVEQPDAASVNRAVVGVMKGFPISRG